MEHEQKPESQLSEEGSDQSGIESPTPPSHHRTRQVPDSSRNQPFEDFMPYPGCRLVIINNDKLQALPEPIKAKLQMAFDLIQESPQQFFQMNDAILEEMVAIEE